jgi:hypothetical protein
MHYPIRYSNQNLTNRHHTHQPALFKAGEALVPVPVKTTPKDRHTGEKWESDKNHNKTQHSSHQPF